MKIKIQIVSWMSGLVLFELEKEGNTVKETVVEAINKKANLYEANLRGADLHGANLYEANLYEANLYGANLYGADLRGADLRGADLREANLYGADLHGANLRGADLREANLREANLYGADLRGANLHGANLRGADLRGAEDIQGQFHAALNILRSQKNPLRAFKYLTSKMTSPYNGKIEYRVGEVYEESVYDSSDFILCGSGLNVANLEWCIVNCDQINAKFIEVEFLPEDIVSIPFNTDGKFRVKKLKVIRKLTEKEIEAVKKRKYE